MISILSIKDKVLLGCKASNITLTELANKMGVTQPTLSKRLKVGKLTQDELSAIAKMLDCEYHPIWILPDGTKIE